MKRDKRAGAEAGVGPTGFSTGAMPAYSDGRGAPDGIRSVTNRSRASRNGAVVFAVVVFVLAFGIVLAAAQAAFAEIGLVALVSAAIVGWLASSSVHIVLEWEKAVVLRFGKFNRVAGPGLIFMIPLVEYSAATVDMRMRSTAFKAEHVLTADLVPVNVDAVLFWMVWDAEKACLEVENYYNSVSLVAQTALRDAIGRAGAAEVAIRREQLDRELKRVLEEKVAPWGITVLSVEIRDILLPKELQDVMSLEAQAEQRKKARIILMEAEQDICEMMDDMGDTYAKNDVALRLRAMHLLYESVRETGGTVVVPSSFSEGFGDVLGDVAKDVLGKGSGL